MLFILNVLAEKQTVDISLSHINENMPCNMRKMIHMLKIMLKIIIIKNINEGLNTTYK